MKLYVGVLYSGENEFDACVESVESQDYNDFEYFVIKGLAKKEAIDTLNKEFRESDFDVLVQVGADTVLTHHRLFTNVINKIKENPWIQHYSIALHDFFSDQLIWGLNFYHNIEWAKSDEQVFTDFIPVDKKRTVTDFGILAPAAYHCPNPGLFQSFHYGSHKAMKILEASRRGMTEKLEYYRDIIRKTNRKFLKTNDIKRAACISGARFGISNNLGPEHLDYTNPYLENEFNRLLRGKD